jgi:hypothetical protein
MACVLYVFAAKGLAVENGFNGKAMLKACNSWVALEKRDFKSATPNALLDVNLCMGFMHGVLSSENFISNELIVQKKATSRLFCVSHIKQKDIVYSIIKQWNSLNKDNSSALELPAIALIIAQLQRDFPCEK